MLFRPKYCSNCGENIDHAVWHFWTSRRFCDVCVTEFPIHEYAPKAVVGTSVLVILGAITSYLGAGNTLKDQTPERRFERTSLAAIQSKNTPAVIANKVGTPEPSPTTTSPAPAQLADMSTIVSVEPQYFCGAATKKGTPCSRKVKGNTRCYQHQGMPAMASANKSKLG